MPTRIDRADGGLVLEYTPLGYVKALAGVCAGLAAVGLVLTIGLTMTDGSTQRAAVAGFNTLALAAIAFAFSRSWRTSTLRITGDHVAFELKFRLGGARRFECTTSDITGVRVAGTINWAQVLLDTRSRPLHVTTIARSALGKRVLGEVLAALALYSPTPPQMPDGLRRWWDS